MVRPYRTNKEVTIVLVLTVLRKYIVSAIKSVLVLLQNVPNKIPGCIRLYQDISSILASIDVSANTANFFLKCYLSNWVNVLGLIFRLIKYLNIKFYVDKHEN